jgi:hypothetical protein
MENKKTKWSVKVFGSDFLKGPVLDTDDVKLVVFFDTNDQPQAAFARIDDTKFMFGSAGQEDWEQFKRRFGL